MMSSKLAVLSLAILASSAAVAASQADVDREVFEYINRTSLSKQSIVSSLLEENFDKRTVDIAIAKAEKEWGGPAVWNDKAIESAESAMSGSKLSCPDLLSELVQKQKFTVEQSNYAAKKLKVCQ